MFVGHSLGGITTIDALYTMPETFNAYVAIDPSLWWDNRVLLKQARDKFSKPGLAGRALFVGQANTITPGDTTINVHYNSIVQFNSILETFNKSGVRYGYKYYPNDSHGSVPIAAEYDALRFIFNAYDVSLAQAIERPDYLAEHFARASTALGYKMDPPEDMVDLVGHVALGRDSTAALKLFEDERGAVPDERERARRARRLLAREEGFHESARSLRESAIALAREPRGRRTWSAS